MSVTVSLVGQMNLTDSDTGTTQLAKVLTGLATTGSVSELTNTLSLASGANAVALPVSPTQYIYLKNLHPTNTVIVTWTPLGGSSNPVCTLGPGGWIIMGNSSAGGGISALSLNASAAGTPVEFLFLG